MKNLKELVRDVPDFPIPGVMFRDITPILSNAELFAQTLAQLSSKLGSDAFDTFIGIESRGFILGSALAARMEKGFVPLRKAGKLPPPVEKISYKLEYGEATLEVASGSKGRVVIVDDVLATGGTLQAAISLCEKAGFEVVDVLVLIDLKFLNQFRFKGREVKSLLEYT